MSDLYNALSPVETGETRNGKRETLLHVWSAPHCSQIHVVISLLCLALSKPFLFVVPDLVGQAFSSVQQFAGRRSSQRAFCIEAPQA